jgi:hypothetical protein
MHDTWLDTARLQKVHMERSSVMNTKHFILYINVHIPVTEGPTL